ncbi:receptor expression-enhancing protein 6-like [Mobula hypostoma]|uniref:receptor expression-enhancing protein 6-like n=1 Tax=Mobula hypostoma TaxID=723540 RepID=UPI002FC36F4B
MSLSVSRFVRTLIALVALCSLLGFGPSLFTWFNVIVFLYPAYFSVLAIESADKKEKLKWLSYWVIYGTFAIVECVASILFYAFPAFYKLKTLLLLWCMAPVDWNGSHIIYTKVIHPFVYTPKPTVEEINRKSFETTDDDIKPEGSSTMDMIGITSTPKARRNKLSAIFGKSLIK